MKILEVAKDLDLDGPLASNGTAINLASSDYDLPFKPGATVTAMICIVGWAEAEQEGASIILQGSDDDVSYSTLLECSAAQQPFVMAQITLPQYIRVRRASATAGDGRGSVYLLD